MTANLPDYPDSQLEFSIRGRIRSGGIDALSAAHFDLGADQFGGIEICLVASHANLHLVSWYYVPRRRCGEGRPDTDDHVTCQRKIT